MTTGDEHEHTQTPSAGETTPHGAPSGATRRDPSTHSKGVRVGSLVIGGVLVAVGVPMLVLPGPGIAAIAGGGVLIARGLRGKKGR